jgi:hypothetical protein
MIRVEQAAIRLTVTLLCDICRKELPTTLITVAADPARMPRTEIDALRRLAKIDGWFYPEDGSRDVCHECMCKDVEHPFAPRCASGN